MRVPRINATVSKVHTLFNCCILGCYLRDLELVDLFDNRVIEQVYFKTGIRSVFGYRLFVQNAPFLSG